MSKELGDFVKACIARGDAYEFDNIEESNKHATDAYEIYKLLKSKNRLEELKNLLRHEKPYVRLAAATYCLQFEDTRNDSEQILEELRKLKGNVKLEARMTLFVWRHGKLMF